MDQLESMAATLADAEAELVTILGGHRETSRLRLWHGQVLVDWEPDARAGGCLLRPALVQRLIALHAHVESSNSQMRLRASGRTVAALSPEHRDLVASMGGEHSTELRVRLQFDGDRYLGGEEQYSVVRAGQRVELMRLCATVTPRVTQPESPRTSHVPR
jgi:hypothetical protein